MYRSLSLALGCALGLIAAEGRWLCQPVASLDGFSVPESVAVDARDGNAYVSNIVAAHEGVGVARFWSDDGSGFISRLAPLGSGAGVSARDWRVSTGEVPMGSLKGALVHDGCLWVVDNAHLLCIDLATGVAERERVPGARWLNDITSDGERLYLSDTAESAIFRRDVDGSWQRQPGPPAINGLLHHRGELIAVSWDAHDLYRCALDGSSEPRPLGLADHFVNLDGIVALPDGQLLVADFSGHRLAVVDLDTGESYTLCRVRSPADIAFDSDRQLLYVPSFQADQVLIFRLSQQ